MQYLPQHLVDETNLYLGVVPIVFKKKKKKNRKEKKDVTSFKNPKNRNP